MIRYGSYRSGKVKVELSALGMSCRDGIDVLKYAIQEVVNVSLGDIIACNNNSVDCNCLDIRLCPISVSRNRCFAVVRRLLNEGFDEPDTRQRSRATPACSSA